MRLTDFKVLTFDCYGTLIDWETGILEALQPLVERADRPLSRDAILEVHGRHEAAQQQTTPTKLYRDLLAVVYKRLAEEWGVRASWDECVAYGRSVGDWPPFDDTAEALQYLAGHFKLAILSNVDNESFDLSRRKLGAQFDAIFTAEDIGSYKPSLRNFEYMLDKLGGMGLRQRDILHTAESMFHDHVPANALGLANCWIHRRHDKKGFGAVAKPETTPTYDFRFVSLGEFSDAHRRELGGGG